MTNGVQEGQEGARPGLWDRLLVRCVVAALATSAATALASAPLEWTWTPWICLVPLLRSFDGQGWKRSFLIGWCAGMGTNVALFTWLGSAFGVYGQLNLALAALLFAVFVALMGLQYGLLGLADCAIRKGWPRGRLALFPCAFVAVELLWPRIFPWHVSTPLVIHPLLTQIAEWGGQLALTYVIVSTNCGLDALFTWRRAGAERGPLPWPAPAWAAALLVLTLGYGGVRLGMVRGDMESAPTLRLAVVQPGVVRNLRNDVQPHVVQAALLQRAREAKAGGAQLTVFSEGALPQTLVRIEESPEFPATQRQIEMGARQSAAALRQLALAAGSPVLVGGGYATVQAESETHVRYLDQQNSMFQLNRDGEIVDRYDKHVLLPFAEYLPLEETFPSLRGLLPVAGRMSAGPGPRVLTVDEVRVAPLVCYEGVSPSVVRSYFGEAPPHVLLNATNDVWFSGQGPHLHRMIVLWRAVETRRPLVRVTSTGLSVVVLPDGTLLAETQRGEATTRLVDLPLLEGSPTLYTRCGELFGWLVLLAGVAALLYQRHKARLPSLPG